MKAFKDLSRSRKLMLAAAGAFVLLLLIRPGRSNRTEVSVCQPERRDLVESVPASGTVRPVVEVKISPDVSGEVVEICAKEGDHVEAGDLILRIRPDLYLSQVEQASASLGTLRAQFARQRAEERQARANHERNQRLFELNAISAAELQRSRTELDIAHSGLQAAEFAIRSGEAQLKEARENLLKTTLYAPMDGVISRMDVEKGERVVGTSQMPGTELFRIADFSRMEVVVDVGESDIVRIETRDSVEVEIDAYPRRKFHGVVTQIANSAKVANFEVRIELMPDSLKFLPGMSAAVRIITDRRCACLTLPLESIFLRDKDPFVWTVDQDDKARAVGVTTGIQDLDRIEIRDGLSEDQRVVVGPTDAVGEKLKEGQKLKPTAKTLHHE